MLYVYFVGTQATGTQLAEYCGHALLALEVLIHPRSLPLSDFNSSSDNYQALYPSRDSQISNYQPDEPESEEDDLIENWLGKDDEMEIQVTKRQQDTDSPKENEAATSGNDPNYKGMMISNDAVIGNVEMELANRRAASTEIDGAVSFEKRTEASTSEHASEATGNEISIVERISATLSNIDRSKVTMFEPDNEDADIFPDIVDGDPDSD